MTSVNRNCISDIGACLYASSLVAFPLLWHLSVMNESAFLLVFESLFSVKQRDQNPMYCHPDAPEVPFVQNDPKSNVEIPLQMWRLCVCVRVYAYACGCMRVRGNGGASSLSLDKGTNGACGCCGNLCLNITAQGSPFRHTSHAHMPPLPLLPSAIWECTSCISDLRRGWRVLIWYCQLLPFLLSKFFFLLKSNLAR